MKREDQYQVRGCIEECEGHVRWAGEGETPQFWGLYQLEDDGICWRWLDDFESEGTARQVMEIRELFTEKQGERATAVLSAEELGRINAGFELADALNRMAVREAGTVSLAEFLYLASAALAAGNEASRIINDALKREVGRKKTEIDRLKTEKRKLEGEIAAQVTVRGGEA